MKKTDLHKIVREAIQEILSEADISPAEKTAKDAKIRAIDAEIKALQVKKGDLASGREEIGEGEIDEMANVAVGYQLAPDVNAEDFTGKKRQIILAMQSTDGPIGKPEVAKEMGYTMINKRGEVVGKQNPINADFMALVADGTIIPAGTQAAPRLNRPQPTIAEPGDDEDTPAGYEGPEGGIEGDMSDEEIEASFARMMGSGEEEPEAGEIETADVTTGRMSDEDYEAFMQYTDLENRLSKVKSDILKTKRSRPSIGDISDTPSNELQNLRDLKARLQTKMDGLLAGNEYLQSRQAKLNKKAAPEETETEPLDEWTKGRMQYYAGIKK
jgi:hypothetical protein